MEVGLPASLTATNDQFCLPERLRCALPLWKCSWPPLDLAPGERGKEQSNWQCNLNNSREAHFGNLESRWLEDIASKRAAEALQYVTGSAYCQCERTAQREVSPGWQRRRRPSLPGWQSIGVALELAGTKAYTSQVAVREDGTLGGSITRAEDALPIDH